MASQVPEGFRLQEAVTLPNNFATVYHSCTKDLEIPLLWPRPTDPLPTNAREPILVWGGSSSVGIYALQILYYYGYRNLIAVASRTHHEYLSSLGAVRTFDYRDQDVADQILEAEPAIPYIIDCIGSKDGSLMPLARVAQQGAKVAVLLPVIVRLN